MAAQEHSEPGEYSELPKATVAHNQYVQKVLEQKGKIPIVKAKVQEFTDEDIKFKHPITFKLNNLSNKWSFNRGDPTKKDVIRRQR